MYNTTATTIDFILATDPEMVSQSGVIETILSLLVVLYETRYDQHNYFWHNIPIHIK